MSSARTKATPLERDSADFRAGITRAFRLTKRINELGYDDRDAIRAAWGELTGREPDERFTLIPPFYCDHGLDIRIGRNVWIASGAQVLQGVTIGADAVIGAGAVVSRDVPAATLAVGVPAAPVRDLSGPSGSRSGSATAAPRRH